MSTVTIVFTNERDAWAFATGAEWVNDSAIVMMGPDLRPDGKWELRAEDGDADVNSILDGDQQMKRYAE